MACGTLWGCHGSVGCLGLRDTVGLSRESRLPWPVEHCGVVTGQWATLACGTLWGSPGTLSRLACGTLWGFHGIVSRLACGTLYGCHGTVGCLGLRDTVGLSRYSGLPWPTGHCGVVTGHRAALAYGTLRSCHGTVSRLGCGTQYSFIRESSYTG